MSQPPLSCSVRACGLPLTLAGRTWACPRGHCFDLARTGYVNLLQPNDRRSLEAGDGRAAVEARARLLAAGVGRVLFHRFVEEAVGLLDRAGTGDPPVVVELGSGSGDTLEAVAHRRAIIGVGIDLSTAAAAHAARRSPAVTWVVANADRRLPLLPASATVVLSQHARRNPAECARVLRPGGHLLVSVPAADDLIELREAVQGTGHRRQRHDTVVAEHAPFFVPIGQFEVRERATLGRDLLLDLLRGTYRGARASVGDRIATLERLTVTLASTGLILALRHSGDPV